MIEKPKPREIQAKIESYAESQQKDLLLSFSEYLAKLDVDNWDEISLEGLPENSSFNEIATRKFNNKQEEGDLEGNALLEDYKKRLKSELLSNIKENRTQFVKFLREQYQNNREDFEENIEFIEKK